MKALEEQRAEIKRVINDVAGEIEERVRDIKEMSDTFIVKTFEIIRAEAALAAVEALPKTTTLEDAIAAIRGRL